MRILKLFLLLSAFGLVCALTSNCTGSSDPVDVMPTDTTAIVHPPPTILDSLMGNHSGYCAYYSRSFNSQTGLWTITNDTLPNTVLEVTPESPTHFWVKGCYLSFKVPYNAHWGGDTTVIVVNDIHSQCYIDLDEHTIHLTQTAYDIYGETRTSGVFNF